MSAILEPMLYADIAHCADLMTCSGTLIKLVPNYFNRDEIGGNKMPRKRSTLFQERILSIVKAGCGHIVSCFQVMACSSLRNMRVPYLNNITMASRLP